MIITVVVEAMKLNLKQLKTKILNIGLGYEHEQHNFLGRMVDSRIG